MSRVTSEERNRMHSYLDECIDKMNSAKNSSKVHWSSIKTNILHKMLAVEVAELELATICNPDNKPEPIIDECKDVINIALMIVDNLKMGLGFGSSDGKG